MPDGETVGPEAQIVSYLEADQHRFERPGFFGAPYVTAEQALGFTALVISAHDRHPRKRMTGDTTRLYFVTEGSGHFVINGEERRVGRGNLVILPPESEYEYRANPNRRELLTLFEINISPTNSFTDEKLEP